MAVINWQTDPLLLDDKPTAMNEWVTANKIVSKDREGTNDFFDEKTMTLKLYPILVRKIDFVQRTDSDRILSRFPFLVLTADEKELIREKILLIAEFARDYFYKSINSGIMDWKRRLQTYLKRGAMPYPLYRCACEVLGISLDHSRVDKVFFESARGKRYSIPTKLINALVYLCGVCNGDGHLKPHWLRITDETREYMVLISKLCKQLFDDPGEIFETGNAWNAELRSQSVVRLINFLTDQTIGGAKYDSLREPLLFKQLGSPIRNLYWRGAMDADGGFKQHISFTSASKDYIKDYQIFLQSIDISSTIQPLPNGACNLYLPAKDKIKYVEHVGLLNPKKSDDLLEFVQRKRTYADYNGLKKNVLTEDGYFNLDLLDSLFITGLGDVLEEYRAGRSYSSMDNQFEMSQGSYSMMEKNQRSLPFHMLKVIIDENQLYEVLNKSQNITRYQVSNSSSIKLPLKPSDELDKILHIFEPKLRFVSVKVIDEENEQRIKELFDVVIDGAHISSRMLIHYLMTFFDFVELNPSLTIREFFYYKKKWRLEIFS